MAERPILFSGPMVRAILEGRKTQTRRVAIPKRSCVDFIGGGPKDGPDWNDPTCWGFEDPNTGFWWALRGNEECHQLPCPYGNRGDRLWVREAWQHSNHPLGPYDADCLVHYRADYLDDPHGPDGEKSPEGRYRTWRPSIHMPRAASRITLEITGVLVERLNDCSEDDARAEGSDAIGITFRDDADGKPHLIESLGGPYRDGYRILWESINGAGSWEANPWVWVVEFRRIES